MKKYFAKYLPVEGEIKIGDKIRSESISSPAVTVTGITDKGDYITDEIELVDPFGGSYYVVAKQKAVKLGNLFLCSKDIQVGDLFKNKMYEDFICKNVTQGDGSIYFPKEILIWTWDESDGNIKHWRPVSECFKTIGEISPDALEYVKEGDEFEEDEVRFIVEPGEDMDTEYIPLNEFESYYIGRGYRKPFPDYITYLSIALKGPCGHFH